MEDNHEGSDGGEEEKYFIFEDPGETFMKNTQIDVTQSLDFFDKI